MASSHKKHFDLNALSQSLNQPTCPRPRKIPAQNIVVRLLRRETGGINRGNDFATARKFYQNVFPNFTIVNVEKPPCFLRKFSPDGRFLIAFSLDQTSLEIYRFKGSAAAGALLSKLQETSDSLSDKSEVGSEVRRHIFSKFFYLSHVVNVSHSVQRLNRECSLFSVCGRYVPISVQKKKKNEFF